MFLNAFYRRSERLSIDINHLTDVGISEEDYQALTVDQSIGAVSSNSNQLKELTTVQAEVERLILENERIIDERSSIQNDNEKLQLHVQQLSDEKAALNTSCITALEDANAYADKFAQLADQSQRLQQSAQKQLTEPKKGFWARYSQVVKSQKI